METFLIKGAQLLLSLSLLVLIHELGHFLFVRLFKIRVEKFYLFFNPWFSLFKYKPKNSDTEYGIGWLPLGGYVKIAGMIDESMDKEQMAQPEQPWEFRSKPAWQRLLVMIGGVLFNFILAIIIFSLMTFTWGTTYIPQKDIKSGIYCEEPLKAAGFHDKDILVSADGKELREYDGILRISEAMRFVDAKEVTVVRDGKLVEITMPQNLGEQLLESGSMPGYSDWVDPVLDSVFGSAKKAGLMKGDSIVAFNNQPVSSYNQLNKLIAGEKSKLEDNMTFDAAITFYRDTVQQTLTVRLDTAQYMGISPSTKLLAGYKTKGLHTEHYGFFESFPVGISIGVKTLKAYVSQSRFLFTKKGAQSVSGFGGIGKMFPASWNWQGFWTMTAFLSIILAFMNILPIPALDGGHIMFLLYEVIARRKPNEKFVEYATTVGFFLLIALVLYANGKDIVEAVLGK